MSIPAAAPSIADTNPFTTEATSAEREILSNGLKSDVILYSGVIVTHVSNQIQNTSPVLKNSRHFLTNQKILFPNRSFEKTSIIIVKNRTRVNGMAARPNNSLF
jgi:hypothetical protein